MSATINNLTVEEKREALNRVFQSQTFARSDRLKDLLRFVCEAEIEGRCDDLNEYVIGTEALGRPSGFSPGEDSSVRRVHIELPSGNLITFDDDKLTVQCGGTEVVVNKDGDVSIASNAKVSISAQGDIELSAQGKLLERQRLEQRTMYDLESIEQMGFCSGIENYSRHLTGRAPGQKKPKIPAMTLQSR